MVFLLGYSVWSDLEPSAGCESEGIHYIQMSLLAYLKYEHPDALPSETALKVWANKNSEGQYSGNIKPFSLHHHLHYNWEGMSGHPTKTPERALVWCATSHGPFWHSYKNVLFSDGSLRSVPLSEFQNIFSKIDSTRNAKYRCVHKCFNVESIKE